MSSKVVVYGEAIPFIYCGCNCGLTRPKYDKQGREGKYIRGHTTRGKKFSDITRQNMRNGQLGRKLPNEVREKVRISKLGENNPNFGKIKENITNRALHRYIRRHYPCPKLCQMCKQKPPKDLANLTGLYNRDFNNWAYLCRICHQIWDNIPERTLKHRWSKK